MKHLSDETLLAYQLGELEETKDLERHLILCDACREKWREWTELHDIWHLEKSEGSLPAGFTERIMEAVAREKPVGKNDARKQKQHKKALFHFALSAAATFVLLSFGVFEEYSLATQQMVNLVNEGTLQFHKVASKGAVLLHEIDWPTFRQNG